MADKLKQAIRAGLCFPIMPPFAKVRVKVSITTLFRNLVKPKLRKLFICRRMEMKINFQEKGKLFVSDMNKRIEKLSKKK